MCSLVRESIVNQDVSCVSSQENVAGLDGHHTVDLYCRDHESLWWEEGGWNGRKGERKEVMSSLHHHKQETKCTYVYHGLLFKGTRHPYLNGL